ncbi:carboxymuconolactone decarboxylase family protein [Bacteroidota bacterium]
MLFYKYSTGNALSNLAQTLLLGKSPLNSGERELIAAYVSHLNACEFCHSSHAAACNVHLDDQGKLISEVITNLETANLPAKMKALLKIAAKVQESGKRVSANEEEIHDTVLIAAAFCMFNRYVDGLGASSASPEEYAEMGKRMSKGYKMPPRFLKNLVLKLMRKRPTNP